MEKMIAGIFLLFGILFCLGAFGTSSREVFLAEILFGPALIYIGLELLKWDNDQSNNRCRLFCFWFIDCYLFSIHRKIPTRRDDKSRNFYRNSTDDNRTNSNEGLSEKKYKIKLWWSIQKDHSLQQKFRQVKE